VTDFSKDPFDPYAELQLSPDAEPELIKAAFKALAKKYHPDRYTDPTEKAQAEQRMARINEAQRLLQSGSYSPPPKPETVSPQSSSTETQQGPPPSPPPKDARSPKAKPIPLVPFLFAAALFLSLLVLPARFSGNHLERALEFEKQGQLQQSLEQMNQAVARQPHDRELYRHRARLWQKLGEPERAAVDLKNAEVPTLSLPTDDPDPDQVPDESGEKSGPHVPRT
jgi:tetratricopeptide (TPR) repeat protein